MSGGGSDAWRRVTQPALAMPTRRGLCRSRSPRPAPPHDSRGRIRHRITVVLPSPPPERGGEPARQVVRPRWRAWPRGSTAAASSFQTVSADPSASSCGRSHSEKFRSSALVHVSLNEPESGATFEYRQTVSLLWQSKQARTASARVRGESQAGSSRAGGFVWFRPYGTAWMARSPTTAAVTTHRSALAMASPVWTARGRCQPPSRALDPGWGRSLEVLGQGTARLPQALREEARELPE
jgi:hypothetical protein